MRPLPDYLPPRAWCPGICLALFLACLALADSPPRTGPTTEKRFPPLRLPPGFRATLFACDPLIEYPSAIAPGPRPRSLFVAVDYMTGLGTEIVRRDEIRLIEDTDGDGYADRVTVYASNFNSIQGLAYHDGTLYVMHAPYLTALRDRAGHGKADELRDLLVGLGLPPEKNPVRLHCANGVVAGHDGFLYLALGDHGCDVRRPEGDRLVLRGGGILRCRRDGRDLHVFASGLRNIYDVALDEDLNVLVRDNENDGGTYMIRVCHSFFGADHGYPYLYEERPDEALPPLADLGLGSSAGVVCYLERQFPSEYRGNLFCCEWGRSVVHYRLRRQGSGFAPLQEKEFATGADNDPYGFKPTDLVVASDGALFVSDWADGQRPKRGRGRIYRITHQAGKPPPRPLPRPAGLEAWIARLDSESYHERALAQEAIERQGQKAVKALLRAKLGVRGRLHALWAVARAGGSDAAEQVFDLARRDPDPRVQAQAVRALADLADPVLTRHRLDAGRGDAKLAGRLAAWAAGKDERVLLEVVVALGRLRWRDAPTWLHDTFTRLDAPLAHAAMQTLRRSDNWTAVLKLLDRPNSNVMRAVALRAIAEQFVPEVVEGLIARLRVEPDPVRRRQYADALTRVYRRPGPWVYWGYRPPPRPAGTVEWDRTRAIGAALDRCLADPDRATRLVVLRRMRREKIPTKLVTLDRWLREEDKEEALGTLLDVLRDHLAAQTRKLLEAVVSDRKKPASARLQALALLAGGLDGDSEKRLLALAGGLEDGAVLAAVLRQLGGRSRLDAAQILLGKLGAARASVRAAAVEALTARRTAAAASPVRKLLEDPDARVRAAAAAAMGRLGVRETTLLLKLARDSDAEVRRASLESLHLLKEPRAVPPAVAALVDAHTRQAALRCLADLGGPEQTRPVVDLARRDPSAEVLPLVLRMLNDWSGRPGARRVELDRAAADLQGSSGVLARWNVTGPLPAAEASRLAESKAVGERPWRTVFGTGTASRVDLGPGKDGTAAWLAQTEVNLSERTTVQFLAAGNTGLRVWVNGRLLYQRDEARVFRPDSERFETTFERGPSRIVVRVAAKAGAAFHLRFRRKGSKAEHETLTRAALGRAGNVERGRKLFFDAKKSQCVKCHRVGQQGERIGPELTGVGSRFSRIHLVEAILDPSRTVAPGYRTVVVTLARGRVLTGVKVAETDDTLTLADSEGNRHDVKKSAIAKQQEHDTSVMPEGLEKQFCVDEFVDLVAFLASLKDSRPR
jgi:putative membrane-bound dehydrogenase-like protein